MILRENIIKVLKSFTKHFIGLFIKKTACESFYIENSSTQTQIPVHSVKASAKTIARLLLRSFEIYRKKQHGVRFKV